MFEWCLTVVGVKLFAVLPELACTKAIKQRLFHHLLTRLVQWWPIRKRVFGPSFRGLSAFDGFIRGGFGFTYFSHYSHPFCTNHYLFCWTQPVPSSCWGQRRLYGDDVGRSLAAHRGILSAFAPCFAALALASLGLL